jgi:predicted Rdx family selenoprotein
MTPRLEMEYCARCRWLLRVTWLIVVEGVFETA